MADDKRNPNGSEQPPKIRVSGEKKSDTARIDLSKATPPPAVPEGELKEVGKDALSEFYKKSTIRIDQPKKSDTQRIKDETQRIKDDTQKIKDDTQKIMSETKRIDETKQTTMRVEVSEEQKKKETTRLPPMSDLTKRSTAKIDVGEIMEGETEDVFKRKTIPVGLPTPPPQQSRPKTGAQPRPKTSQFKPSPDLGETVEVRPHPSTTADAKKSETARIDLPPEAEERPVTRPKTIRIKRPDGTTARKQLTIARPADAESVAAMAASSGEVDEEDVGLVVSICAAAAVAISAVLLYVLMAQTIAMSLPFPGRV